MLTKPSHRIGWYLWLLLVVISPASTKAAGAAWFVCIIWSFWIAYSKPKLEARTPSTRAIYHATDLLLWWFALAFVIRTIGQFYWWDNWEYRHFDARMLFTAFTLHLLVRRLRPTLKVRSELVIALGLTCIPALFVTLNYIHGLKIPTNIIPWAYGMALFSLVLASMQFAPNSNEKKTEDTISLTTHWFAITGALLLLVAIWMAGVRGAYLAVLWITLTVLFNLRHMLKIRNVNHKFLLLSILVVTISLGLLIKTVPNVYKTPEVLTNENSEARIYEPPHVRINKVLTELHRFQTGQKDTSIGLRLHFVEKSIDAISQKPWIGYGIEQRTYLVNKWGDDVNPSLFKEMTHAHNEYLNSILDYGILGGATTLSYLLGFLFAAFALRQKNSALSITFAGIFFATFTTFLTNTNTLHNYTSVTLGLALFYSFVIHLPLEKSSSSSTLTG